MATYTNPVLDADWPDPDVIRVGDDFWMVASSFNRAPGLPILHSRDLVAWEHVANALPAVPPQAHYALPRHGSGVWAPSLRYHDGTFIIVYPDPDHGIFVLTATDPRGPWSEPWCLLPGRGIIDPCPLWDDDGCAYLVHGWAGSRAGVKNFLTVVHIDPELRRVVGPARTVVDGDELPGFGTLEGPKFYQHDGWYWIFAPAGGVATGWQTVFRSRSVWGPYEHRVVLEQGGTPVNGPHQGAWVDTPDGAHWFLHFQDRDAFGRVVHLQPMTWDDDGWPRIGEPLPAGEASRPARTRNDDGAPVPAEDEGRQVEGAYPADGARPANATYPVGASRLMGASQADTRLPADASHSADASRWADGRGRPVLEHPVPLPAIGGEQREPARSDDFSAPGLATRWHWQANPDPAWHRAPGDGSIHLSAQAAQRGYLREQGAILCQQLPGRASTWTTRVTLHGDAPGTRAGLVVLGREYAWIGLVRTPAGVDVAYARSVPGAREDTLGRTLAPAGTLDLRIDVDDAGTVRFSWRAAGDEKSGGDEGDRRAPGDRGPAGGGVGWHQFAPAWTAVSGGWIGAEVGLFANAPVGVPVTEGAGATFGPVDVVVAGRRA